MSKEYKLEVEKRTKANKVSNWNDIPNIQSSKQN